MQRLWVRGHIGSRGTTHFRRSPLSSTGPTHRFSGNMRLSILNFLEQKNISFPSSPGTERASPAGGPSFGGFRGRCTACSRQTGLKRALHLSALHLSALPPAGLAPPWPGFWVWAPPLHPPLPRSLLCQDAGWQPPPGDPAHGLEGRARERRMH